MRTQDALRQFVKRSVFQASIWAIANKSSFSLSFPEEWSWQIIDGQWRLFWTTICEAAKAGQKLIKIGLSPSKKICFICFNESPLKVMKNVFYFILQALLVLQIFKYLS